MLIDCNHIYTHKDGGALFQGSMPPVGSIVSESKFDVLVLCALENQDERELYTGVEIIRAPGDDVQQWPIDSVDLENWVRAARLVAERVAEGKDVLVTCMAGLNRSGFVTALALHHLTSWDGVKCVWWIQRRRKSALFNKDFVRYLTSTLVTEE